MSGVIRTFLFFCLFGITFVRAQVGDVNSIRFNPPVIQVGTATNAELRAPTLATETALIQWKLGGISIAQGIGMTEATFKISSSEKKLLEVTVVERDGTETKISQEIRPSDVDLLWEGQSYTPPLYKGRALPGSGGKVTLAAIPHLANSTPDTFIYSWNQDGVELKKQSGFGKYAITIQMPTFGDSTRISVKVKNLDGEVVGENGVRIEPSDIIVALYMQKPLVGLWADSSALFEQSPDQEITLRAFPFFTDGASLNKNISMTWKTSSGAIKQIAPTSAQFIPKNTGKDISISVSLQNASKLLQQASKVFTWKQTEQKSLFGI